MKKRHFLVLSLLAMVQGMVIVDNAVVNITLPTIKEALHFTTAELQWVITAYTLTFGGFLLLGGRLSDYFGRKRILLISLSLFILLSLLVGLSQSSIQLILFRAVQGLSAALMMPAALSTILILFTGKSRATALAMWSTFGSLGAACGMLFGGLITQHIGWQWAFFINIPIGLITILGICKIVPKTNLTKPSSLDWLGALLITSSLSLLVYTLTLATKIGWANNFTIGLAIASTILGLLFIRQENKVKDPLIPLKLFLRPSIIGANVIMACMACSLYGMLFFTSLYVQNVLHYSPAACGVCFVLFPLLSAGSAAGAPFLLRIMSLKSLLILGTTLLTIGTYFLTFISQSGTFYDSVFPGLVSIAAGLGLIYLGVNVTATSGIKSQTTGLASGLITTSQQLGSAIGLAILTAITVLPPNTTQGDHINTLITGYQHAFWGITISGIIATAVGLLCIPKESNSTKSLSEIPASDLA